MASSVIDRTRLQHADDAITVEDECCADRSARSTTIGLVLLVGVREPLGRTTPVHVAGIPDEVAFRIHGAPATGRIVLLEYGVTRPDLSRFERCGSTWSYGDARIRCRHAVP